MEGLKKGILVRNGTAVGALGDKYFSNAPIGVIQAFSGQTAPYGYLLCNGASYKVADYPDLYAVIGNTYGGDSTNFNVPNLVDKFIEGSTASGTEKEAGLPNITGTFYHDPNVTSTLSGAFFSYKRGNSRNLQNDAANAGSGYVNFDASKSNPIYGNSDTVQPPALTMVYIIKAFHTNEGVDSDGISDEYSTYEIKTNKVWIDGKPIYRKVINFGTLPNNNVKKVSHGILNIDTFVSINGITFTSEKTATALPYAHSDSTNEVSLFIESTNVAIRTFGNKTNYIKTYVTLEYTKTTDA